MEFETYRKLCLSIKGGKKLPSSIYLHKDSLNEIPEELKNLVFTASKTAKIRNSSWDIVKFHKVDYKLSLLSYPDFYEYPYPALNRAITIQLDSGLCRTTNYTKSKNPPILHRRETFFITPHSESKLFESFTNEGIELELYKNPRTIGFRENWHRLIKRKGYQLTSDGHLIPTKLDDKPSSRQTADANAPIQRHKTAIQRHKLSLPMFMLAQNGYLDGSYTVLDYGCGHGDDARELKAHGLKINQWDPYHHPDGVRENSDVVNLGFVINVIEDTEERDSTIKSAFDYANKLIAVSAMLTNSRVRSQFAPFKDGVITKTNTFQKYYSQSQLREYIENTLQTSAIPIGQGIFLVFKDKLEEQSYFLKRQQTKIEWKKLSYKKKPKSQTLNKTVFTEHGEILESFWLCCLDLGRIPGADEFDFSMEVAHLCNSLNKAFQQCTNHFDYDQFTEAQKRRKNDLLVYFALSFFSKRPTYSRMPKRLQRDIKEFFDLYTNARKKGEELLFSIASPGAIESVCTEAANTLPACELNSGHDLIFHRDFLNDCPPLLRAYVGCAIEMFGEISNVDLIKAHFNSGKVSFMTYDDFNKTQPLLIERVKVDLRNQRVDFFDYIPPDYLPVPLTNKAQFIAPN